MTPSPHMSFGAPCAGIRCRAQALLAGALLLLGLGNAAHAQEAARILTVAGNASLERQGRAEPLAPGAGLAVGDVVAVGEQSAVQMRFSDESIVALRANTRLKIEDYSYRRGGQPDRSLLSLLRGGLRTITGSIARDSRESYRVITPTATLGVRGTHYALVTCAGDCELEGGGRAPDGVFGGVTEGRIVIANEAGESEFGQQEYFYVASAATAPVRLLTPPTVLSARPAVTRVARAGGPDAAAAGDRRPGNVQQSVAAIATATGRTPAQVALATRIAAATAANDRPAVVSLIAGDPIDVSFVLARGTGGALEIGSDDRTVREIKAEIPAVQNEVFFNAATLAQAFIRQGGQVERLEAAGIYWSYLAPPANVSNSLGQHSLWGDRLASLPTSGVATYKYGGGTTPTDNAGRTGSISAGLLSIDFTSRQVKTLDPISVSFQRLGAAQAVSYTVPTASQWGLTDGTQRIGGVTCTGCVNPQGTVSGRVVGAQAQGYAAGFGFQGQVPGAAATDRVGHAAAVGAAFGRQ